MSRTSPSREPKASQSTLSHFQNPPAAYRGKPLWAWNGRLEKKELKRQIEVLAEMGMGGFFMHSRAGLVTEYLGKDWFDAVVTCAREAEKLGLEGWLYDEDRWPSGSAGGLVTKDPEFRMRYLRCEVLSSADLKKRAPVSDACVVSIFAGTVRDLNLSEYRLFSPDSDRLRADESLLVFTVESVRPHGFFNGGTYLDTLNPAAVQRFLQITHERYRKACGGMFGRSIPGIFTDEPHRGLVMSDAPLGWTYPPQTGWVTPWTGKFAEHFTKLFGYDLRERLPELFLQLDGEQISPVKWQYMEALHSLFLESWAKPCRDWCKRHGLQLTGHMLGEESPGAQAITCGSAMRYYEHLDVPGMDLLGRNNRAFWIARQVSSIARQFGRQWTMSELYGCTGWQTSFADHKEIGDWQAMYGINLRCHHLSWYSMAGESKRDFPASIFYQSAWYREYRVVEDYYARLHVLLQQGNPVCDLLVVHPVESTWARIHAGWGGWMKSVSPEAINLDRTFETLFQWVTAAGIDFDYGDEGHLAKLGKIVGSGEDARLRLGLGKYRAVLVGGLETMRSTTLRLLERFRDAGGLVIFAGAVPTHVDALANQGPAKLSRRSQALPFNRNRIAAALHRLIPPMARVENARIKDESRPLLIQTRKVGKSWTIAVCNTDPTLQFDAAQLVFLGTGAQVQEWDCRTGIRYAVAHAQSGGEMRWTFSLAPLGERVFRITPASDRRLRTRPGKPATRFQRIRGPFAYKLDEPNALVLDRFEWRTGSGRWHPTEDILSIEGKLDERMGIPTRSLGMVQPWARPPAPSRPGTPITLRAGFTAKHAFPITLVLEQPERWKVTLNGRGVDTSTDKGWFVDPCFRKITLPAEALKVGENRLTLSASYDEGLDLEAVYLIGEFGVYGADSLEPTLDRLPEQLDLGDVCTQGLPHYSGRIEYNVPLPSPNQTPRTLRFPAFGGAVVRIRAAAEKETVVLPFPPYDTVLPAGTDSVRCEVILTRRNLFGPLHWNVENRDFVAPASFRTTGENYSPTPLLEPSGLLVAPELER